MLFQIQHKVKNKMLNNVLKAKSEPEYELLKRHPAVEWALQTKFSPIQVDCTTAVALKILDDKCKMLLGEKAAVMAIYDVVKHYPADLFDASIHDIISQARNQTTNESLMQTIHQLRVEAENTIPKPVMKQYKVFLRHGLFG